MSAFDFSMSPMPMAMIPIFHDPHFLWLGAGVGGVLVIASIIGAILARTAKTEKAKATISNMNDRTRAWWIMVLVFAGALACGRIGVVVLFGLLSWLALREFITLAPTRRGDHRALFWAFFVITPVQYIWVGKEWYGMFSIFVPVWSFLFLAVRAAMAGECEHYLERIAKTQWGLMTCVYCLSHAPALLTLPIAGYEGQNAKLLVFLVAIVQMSDVLQYVWGKLFGKHKVAPKVSPSKTWEGLVGGILTASALGAGLWWATPFTPLQAGLVSLAITIAGFFGGLVMSAIKRDRGVKDYGVLIEGHGGVMDRMDSLCFAAPVFFHILRFWWTVVMGMVAKAERRRRSAALQGKGIQCRTLEGAASSAPERLRFVVKLKRVQFALPGPIVRVGDEIVAHGIIAHVIPSCRVVFAVSKLPVPEILLPDRMFVGTWPATRRERFPVRDPAIERE